MKYKVCFTSNFDNVGVKIRICVTIMRLSNFLNFFGIFGKSLFQGLKYTFILIRNLKLQLPGLRMKVEWPP